MLNTKISTTEFAITETLGFNATYNLPERKIKLIQCETNPNNKRVVFGSLSGTDLTRLVNDFSNEKITQAHIKHNRFAFYRHQII